MIVAQLVRASDCGSEGRGFESHLSPQLFLPPQEIVGGFFMPNWMLKNNLFKWVTF